MTNVGSFRVVSDEAAEAIWFLGTLALIRGDSDATGGAFDQIEFLHPPGFATPLHVHHTADEAFYVLEGLMRGVCDGVEWVAAPGSFVWLPRGSVHGYAVVGDQPLRSLAMTMPAGFDNFVRESGVPAAEQVLPPVDLPIDFDRVNAAAVKHGQSVLGPPVTHLI